METAAGRRGNRIEHLALQDRPILRMFGVESKDARRRWIENCNERDGSLIESLRVGEALKSRLCLSERRLIVIRRAFFRYE